MDRLAIQQSFTPEQRCEIHLQLLEARLSEGQLYREKYAQLERQFHALVRHCNVKLEDIHER